jgi:UbiD family decarboxylase
LGERGYPDLHDHLRELDACGLLVRVDRPIDKDTELHPLVRWQYRGGVPEAERRAFLFNRVVDSRGRSFEMPVTVGALAATPRIYAIGLGCRAAAGPPASQAGGGPEASWTQWVSERWRHAVAHPVAPVAVDAGPFQEVTVWERGKPGAGLDELPVPISTPGFDTSPYLTCAHFFSRDPETGIQNCGNYRGQVKAEGRMGVNIGLELGQGIHRHWQKYRRLGRPMPVAVAVGGPPAVSYAACQKLPYDVDELEVAGGLLGEPLRVVPVGEEGLLVPAESEIVIEGWIPTDALEPEGAFGESHGYVNLPEPDLILEVRRITRRRDAVFASIISQVTPSESSVIKKVALEPLLLRFLQETIGIRSVTAVGMHEPLTNVRKLIVVQMRSPKEHEVWQALFAAANFNAAAGKIVVAVDEDIDPQNSDAILWALCYRMVPHQDVQIMRGKNAGHGPDSANPYDASGHGALDSALLVNATRKRPLPPVSLPKREYMERARAIWEELGLPRLRPESPWHGYSLGDWSAALEEMAERAVRGDYLANGELLRQGRVDLPRDGGEP